MPRFTFENKFTFGNVIQIGLLLFAVVGAYFGIIGRVDGNTLSITALQKAVAPVESLNVRLTVIESRAASTDQRIDKLVTSIDELVAEMNSDRISSAQIKTDVGYLRDWVESIKREARQ